MKKSNFLLPVTIFLLFLSSSPVKAESIDLSINPSKIFIKENLPIKRNEKITITNNTPFTQLLLLEKKGFKKINQKGDILPITPTKKTNEILTYITITESAKPISTINIDPYTSKDIQIEIKIPSNNQTDDMHLGLLISTQKNKEALETRANGITARSNIDLSLFIPLIIVPTNSTSSLSLTNFKTNLITTSTSPSFQIELDNKTKNAESASINLEITNALGRVVENKKISNKILLSKSKAIITDHLGKSQITPINKLFFGPYKATLTISTSDKKIVKQNTIVFFVLQAKESFILIAILISLSFLTNRVRKQRQAS